LLKVQNGLTLLFEEDGKHRIFNVSLGIPNPATGARSEPFVGGAWEFDSYSLDLASFSCGRVLVRQVSELKALALEILQTQKDLHTASAMHAKKHRGLVAPRWPSVTDSPPFAHHNGDQTRMQLHARTADWARQLLSAWHETERQRLLRPFLRKLGGPTPRPLPPQWRAAHEGRSN
jgi:hypothetical protein